MEKRKKKSITKSLVASLGLASVLLAGIMVPLSCSEETQTQNQPGGNGNNPGGGGGGNTDPTPGPQESKFKQPAEMLNQDNEKSKDLLSQYVNALERSELPNYSEVSPGPEVESLKDIPDVAAISPIEVTSLAKDIVKEDVFVNELIAMFEGNLDPGTTATEPSESVDTSVAGLVAEMKQKTESIKTTFEAESEAQGTPHSTWNHYFSLVSSSTAGVMWTYQESTALKYELFFPSDHLQVDYDTETGMPIVTNAVPADAETAQTPENQKSRLVVTKNDGTETKITYLFQNEKVLLPDSLFSSFPDYFSKVIDNAPTLQNSAKSILDAYQTHVDAGAEVDVDWWNQLATSNDLENENHLKQDLTKKEEGAKSDVLA